MLATFLKTSHRKPSVQTAKPEEKRDVVTMLEHSFVRDFCTVEKIVRGNSLSLFSLSSPSIFFSLSLVFVFHLCLCVLVVVSLCSLCGVYWCLTRSLKNGKKKKKKFVLAN